MNEEMTNSIEFPNSIYEFLLDNSFKDKTKFTQMEVC
jgi:hypothetical protein